MLIQTRDGRLITFNDGQTEALRRMDEWLNKSSDLWFCLEGPAGTGKSTIINELFERNGRVKVCVSAPTHKAKLVVRKTTGKPDFTIQKLLGLQPNVMLEDFDKNNIRFERKEEYSKLKEFALCCIDETSMLSAKLLAYIKEVSIEYRVKILFVGDRCQIPPVKESKSLVFFDDDIIKYNLTKVERQTDGSPILEVCDYLRSLGANYPQFGVGKLVDKVNNSGSVNYYNSNNPQRFGKTLIEAFVKDKLSTKFICYTNVDVVGANEIIRKKLLGETKEIIAVGDVLMSYTNQSESPIVFNSSDYEVVGVEVKEVSSITGKKFKCLVTKLREIDTKLSTTINFIHPDDYDFFLAEDTKLLKTAENAPKYLRSEAWKKHTAFKNQFLIMTDLPRRGRDKGDKNAVLTKDFDYGYAITGHKCQGSTYKIVFINWPDMKQNRKMLERNQLLYVGCSRPTKELHILY